jgi:hypothetical protein
MNAKKLSRMFRPYLDATLDLGLVGFRTSLARESFYQDVYEYVVVSWWCFKWHGHFSLYRPGYARGGGK